MRHEQILPNLQLSNGLKARISTYNLTGKDDIWWQDIKRVNNLKEKYLTWRVFKKYFKRRFMSEQYYEDRSKEFYDLKLGSMSMKELSSKFLSLLRYVPYIIDEKEKIQQFLNYLPARSKDRIEFDNPTTLEEVTRKENFVMSKGRK